MTASAKSPHKQAIKKPVSENTIPNMISNIFSTLLFSRFAAASKPIERVKPAAPKSKMVRGKRRTPPKTVKSTAPARPKAKATAKKAAPKAAAHKAH